TRHAWTHSIAPIRARAARARTRDLQIQARSDLRGELLQHRYRTITEVFGDPGIWTGDGQCGGCRSAGYRYGEAPHADLLLTVVDAITGPADPAELGHQVALGVDALLGGRWQPGALDDLGDVVVGELGEDHLAHAGAVHVHPASDLGEHPHGVRGRGLADVDRPVVIEDRQIGALAQLVCQAREVGPRAAAELPARSVPEAHQARAEGVAARGELTHVSAREQGAHQAMDRGQRQRGLLGQLTERGFAAVVRQQFQQVDGAVDGLDSAGAFRFRRRCAGLGLRHPQFPFFIASLWGFCDRARARVASDSQPLYDASYFL